MAFQSKQQNILEMLILISFELKLLQFLQAHDGHFFA